MVAWFTFIVCLEIRKFQEQLGENRHLKGKHKAHHPFEDAGIGLERCHVTVALAESGGGFQSLVLGDGRWRGTPRRLPFAFQSITVSALNGRVRPTDKLLLRYYGVGVNSYFLATAHGVGRRNPFATIPARRSRPRRGCGSDRRAFSRRGFRHRARHEDWRTFGSSDRNLQRRSPDPS